jgi:hypothetical protein
LQISAISGKKLVLKDFAEATLLDVQTPSDALPCTDGTVVGIDGVGAYPTRQPKWCSASVRRTSDKFTEHGTLSGDNIGGCAALGVSVTRREILFGFLELRDALRSLGVVAGFQWIDGSFSEQCETFRGRPPNDLDVVTFFSPPQLPPSPSPLLATLNDRVQTKNRFKVDHIMVNLSMAPVGIVDHTRFWFGLFSHRRSDDAWKGMVQIDLGTAADDAVEMQQLKPVSLP